ncbi:putative E3 ubiquitin-protein ligase LIN-1 isoform X1 [Iris pallida]|uniref:E3 ubiquitin-protein ligase LIN-1 isoform X1 n=1 Tax=Iris pallida TaxID=29817 RepID=A0AAX6G6K0_IRIPA|nr:putative E3 ubiquitin-protein ligase LIN-1 isoform X1 [Iris pallida]
MASPPSPTTTTLNLKEKPHINSILSIISLVKHHIRSFLADPASRNSLHLQCTTNLTTANADSANSFSDHSVLSNLYWAIQGVERALRCESPDEKAAHIVKTEKMLQVPAVLEEDGATLGVANRYVICCAYFYLCLVQELKGDDWQMTMHFLQSVLVSPGTVKTRLAARLWGSLFGPLVTDEAARQQARRFKDWMMYYQVVSYGEAPPWNGEVSNSCQYRGFGSSRYRNSAEQELKWPMLQEATIAKKIKHGGGSKREKVTITSSSLAEHKHSTEPKDGKALITCLDEELNAEIEGSSDIRCLQDMLEESQSEASISLRSQSARSDLEARLHGKQSPARTLSANADLLASRSNILDRSYLSYQHRPPEDPGNGPQVEGYRENSCHLLSNRAHSSINNLNFSILDLGEKEPRLFSKCYVGEQASPDPGRSSTHGLRCFRSFSSKFRLKYSLHELVSHGSFGRKRINFLDSERDWNEESSNYEKDTHIEMLGKFEKAVSALCISEGPGTRKDVDLEITTLWELLNNKPEVKYSSTRREILDQLMKIISTSEKVQVIRASLYILSILILEDRTIIEDIKRNDLHLCSLASALKKNVQEAAIVIYLLNPSPSEIKRLELLPALVEVACNSNSHKEGSMSLQVTPTSASIAMIEILVTAFDYVTNNMHLSVISSPQVLSKFVNIAMNKNLEEGIALTAIFVRCMRLSGNCRKFLSQVTPVDPFLHLLRCNEMHANFAALEYFQEILLMPRSSAICLLNQIRQQGGSGIMQTLMTCIHQFKHEHQLLAANLLLQLDMLDGSNGKNVFREEALKVLLEAVASENNSNTQALSAFILSNLGGTYAWTGESYTAAWLLKKAGLTSPYHKNMVRNVDWFDPCLQDSEMYAWSAKTARTVIKIGASVVHSLAKGILSKTRSVKRDCLIATAWLGSEMAVTGPSNLRYTACEILLSEVAVFLHPGSELDERVLACLCAYNYTTGKGKQILLNFSEELRESLRRLSCVTWMAEELLKVTEYLLPNQSRVSCVHTQILEVGQTGNGASTALIFYKGQLYAGYSDGTIKVWDIKGQRSVLVGDVKEHKKMVTCFALFEPGDSLLSGSLDKTIRIWKTVNGNLECVEVIKMKEAIQKVSHCGDKIVVVTQSRGLKVCDTSRSIQTICKSKHVRSLNVALGKIYLGCTDASIQEVDITEDRNIEIKAPASRWRRMYKPINSIAVYKGWVYCAGATVEGSSTKEWRRHKTPTISLSMSRGTKVQAMEVVEDFYYLQCSSLPSVIQIWLRGKQQKLGRLSAGSKITCLLAANDIILCGSEAGVIKGWIPL